MILHEEEYYVNGRRVVLRSPAPADAELLIEYLKTVTGETRFLLRYPDEIHYTAEGEESFIRRLNDAEDALMIAAFADGRLAGTCSLGGRAGGRRSRHRAELAIALLQQYTGLGIGRLMMERLLRAAGELGFEQAELTMVDGNDRARRLYERFGFRECGRIPNANKYDDGTYADDVLMVRPLP